MTTDPKALADRIIFRIASEREQDGVYPSLAFTHAEWRTIMAALRADPSAEAMRERCERICDEIAKARAAQAEDFEARGNETGAIALGGLAEGARACGAAIRALSPDPGSAPVEGWQTMETAPKDGSPFLMWLPSDDELGYVPTVHVGFRARCGDVHSAGMCMHMEDGIQPTHWMPLPPPPPADPSRDAQEGERG